MKSYFFYIRISEDKEIKFKYIVLFHKFFDLWNLVIIGMHRLMVIWRLLSPAQLYHYENEKLFYVTLHYLLIVKYEQLIVFFLNYSYINISQCFAHFTFVPKGNIY